MSERSQSSSPCAARTATASAPAPRPLPSGRRASPAARPCRRPPDRPHSRPTRMHPLRLQKAYSSLTSSISADTAVFRCTRGSRSCVTRRMVSCVLRRSARSASSSSSSAGVGNALAADRLGQPIDQTPHAGEEPEAALEPGVGPLDLLLRRRHEHDVEADRVGAELLDHVVGIDDVALRLRHDLAVLEHHALRQQARERLVDRRHAEVAEHAREEPRVDQVEDRVLDAADVEIDRSPVRRPCRDRRAGSDSSDRRTDRSTTTSRRTCPSCRSRAAPARRTRDRSTLTNSGTCASGESPRPVNSATFGSSTGRSSSGTGTMPSFSQYMTGIGVPQYR